MGSQKVSFHPQPLPCQWEKRGSQEFLLFSRALSGAVLANAWRMMLPESLSPLCHLLCQKLQDPCFIQSFPRSLNNSFPKLQNHGLPILKALYKMFWKWKKKGGREEKRRKLGLSLPEGGGRDNTPKPFLFPLWYWCASFIWWQNSEC